VTFEIISQYSLVKKKYKHASSNQLFFTLVVLLLVVLLSCMTLSDRPTKVAKPSSGVLGGCCLAQARASPAADKAAVIPIEPLGQRLKSRGISEHPCCQ